MKSATGTASDGQPSYTQRWFQAFPGQGEDYRRRWDETFHPEPEPEEVELDITDDETSQP